MINLELQNFGAQVRVISLNREPVSYDKSGWQITYNNNNDTVSFDCQDFHSGMLPREEVTINGTVAYSEAEFWGYVALCFNEEGGGSGGNARFGIEDNTGVQDRAVDMGDFALAINGLGTLHFIFRNADDPLIYSELLMDSGSSFFGARNLNGDSFGTRRFAVNVGMAYVDNGSTKLIFIVTDTDRYSPTNINGIFSDAAGTVPLALESVRLQGNIIEGDIQIADGVNFALEATDYLSGNNALQGIESKSDKISFYLGRIQPFSRSIARVFIDKTADQIVIEDNRDNAIGLTGSMNYSDRTIPGGTDADNDLIYAQRGYVKQIARPYKTFIARFHVNTTEGAVNIDSLIENSLGNSVVLTFIPLNQKVFISCAGESLFTNLLTMVLFSVNENIYRTSIEFVSQNQILLSCYRIDTGVPEWATDTQGQLDIKVYNSSVYTALG